MFSPLIGSIIINSIVFGTFAASQTALSNTSLSQSSTIALSGSLAGFLNAFVCAPLDLLKIQLQNQGTGVNNPFKYPRYPTYKNFKLPLRVNEKEWSGLSGCVGNIVKYRGVNGLFLGLGSTLVRDVPSYAGNNLKTRIILAYFLAYDYLTGLRGEEGGVSWLLFSGGLAGVVGWVCTYPVDVIKTRIQAQDMRNREYRNMVDCFRKVYRGEGVRVMFAGLGATVIRAFPTNAATCNFMLFLFMYSLCGYVYQGDA